MKKWSGSIGSFVADRPAEAGPAGAMKVRFSTRQIFTPSSLHAFRPSGPNNNTRRSFSDRRVRSF
jgi:hypothetical protein